MTTKVHAETTEAPVSATGANGSSYPPSLSELRAARRDFEDVPVPELGRDLRLWAISGAGRAAYLARIAGLAHFAELTSDQMADQSQQDIERVMLAQAYLVAGSMGYPAVDWDAVADTLSEAVIDRLYPVAARLSGMQAGAVDEAIADLKETPSSSSGAD